MDKGNGQKRKVPEEQLVSSDKKERERIEVECLKSDGQSERSKFKKVEKLVIDGDQPISWLFKAERYFDIHQLSETEKSD